MEVPESVKREIVAFNLAGVGGRGALEGFARA